MSAVGDKKNEYVAPNTTARQVADHLSKRIVNGELETGRPLKILELAAEYSVSQTSVREALHILEKSYLVESVSRRGFFVKGVTADEIYDVWEIKRRLWGYAARVFTERNYASPEIRDRALELCSRLAAAAQKGKYEDAFSYNFQLSDHLIRYCGNEQLGKILQSIENLVKRWRIRSIRMGDNLGETGRLMVLFSDALRDNRPDLAEQHIEEFIRMDRRTLLEHLNELK
ncbi:GntR family transcriptional regulator [Papillibacter cinnamivorans]|uniref:DNA-binding transcriptional regulator, GntR family n=1 Tax=Papillibacter cinnamivorans DSM 12816 TaxID=1122930 RepID=A0A1W2C3R0_9FIRM|nr:GntR family transcriptional regulator [Papillibacter cinnamivorans]SMC79348.1 DNA-binding transcriptional regulator, GntR family [Papillibacter cinnamivorans DSM 12816]